MDFIALLNSAREAELVISAQLEEIERIHRIMRNASHSREYAEHICEKLRELETQLNDMIDRAADAKRRALAVLSYLEGDKRTVLFQHYILGKDWRKVAKELFFSERHVYNIRKKALDELSCHFSGYENAG